MSEEDVVNLMLSAKSPDQWNEYADLVKSQFGNAYPDFWFRAVILSGVHASTQRKWAKS